MNSAAAFHQWLSGFGIPAYAATSVPDNAKLPYFTYSFSIASFGIESSIQVNLWHGGSEASANAKAEEVHDSLGLGGTTIATDDGGIWLKRGSPSWFAAQDPSDVKHRVINVTIENLGG